MIFYTTENNRIIQTVQSELTRISLPETLIVGRISSKVKHLIAMAAALKVGCTNCILAQTEKALDEGATKEEIIEALQESTFLQVFQKGLIRITERNLAVLVFLKSGDYIIPGGIPLVMIM